MAIETQEPKSAVRRVPVPAASELVVPAAARPPRLVSLDAYRGFIMLVLAMEGFGLALTAQNVIQAKGPSAFWETVHYQFDHTAWLGCTFWDLIQPSFMFMVGVALPFSVASRVTRGDGQGKLILHALWRSVALVFLGIFLMSNHRPMTNWTFENVLTQIGLGYFFVFLLVGRGWRAQLAFLAAIPGW